MRKFKQGSKNSTSTCKFLKRYSLISYIYMETKPLMRHASSEEKVKKRLSFSSFGKLSIERYPCNSYIHTHIRTYILYLRNTSICTYIIPQVADMYPVRFLFIIIFFSSLAYSIQQSHNFTVQSTRFCPGDLPIFACQKNFCNLHLLFLAL